MVYVHVYQISSNQSKMQNIACTCMWFFFYYRMNATCALSYICILLYIYMYLYRIHLQNIISFLALIGFPYGRGGVFSFHHCIKCICNTLQVTLLDFPFTTCILYIEAQYFNRTIILLFPISENCYYFDEKPKLHAVQLLVST